VVQGYTPIPLAKQWYINLNLGIGHIDPNLD
jgi:hypothetical protein